MIIEKFLVALRDAASSPLALVAYCMVVAAWVARTWFSVRPQRRAVEILNLYKADEARNVALSEILGSRPPPNLNARQTLDWIKVQTANKNRTMLLIAYMATLAATVIVVGLAIYRTAESKDDSRPVLIQSTPVRPK
jgi:hypothetical protein